MAAMRFVVIYQEIVNLAMPGSSKNALTMFWAALNDTSDMRVGLPGS